MVCSREKLLPYPNAGGPRRQGLQAAVESEIHGLAMPRAGFLVKFLGPNGPAAGLEIEGSSISANGCFDQVEFFLAPNPGEDPKPLSRIASGGELSRLVLGLKRSPGRRSRNQHQYLRRGGCGDRRGQRQPPSSGQKFQRCHKKTRFSASRICPDRPASPHPFPGGEKDRGRPDGDGGA